jgi:hypothetical protein
MSGISLTLEDFVSIKTNIHYYFFQAGIIYYSVHKKRSAEYYYFPVLNTKGEVDDNIRLDDVIPTTSPEVQCWIQDAINEGKMVLIDGE